MCILNPKFNRINKFTNLKETLFELVKAIFTRNSVLIAHDTYFVFSCPPLVQRQ